jgi:diguanylate cyclase (GGDEF)-like protein
MILRRARTSAAPSSDGRGWARGRGGRRGRRRGADGGSTLAFTVRLCAAVALTFALLGTAGYIAIGDQLQRQLLETYAVEHRADAASFGRAQLHARTRAGQHREVTELLEAIALRPGVQDAVLIAPGNVIDAAGDPADVGRRDSDPRIDATLRHGRPFEGHEADAAADGRDFEFIAPVSLSDGRHAFEVTRDHTLLDTQVRAVRRTTLVLLAVGLLGAALVFYLVGGRALVRSHRIALRRASRDGLTDLPNQRAFHEDLEREVVSAARHGESLALATLDLDHFKLLNDRHGHPHGDALLRRVAAILHDIRAGDRAYRVGGDEFAIVLRRTDADGARVVARRVGAALREAGSAASVGLSALRAGHEPDGLLAEADAALYEAKRHGGATIVHFDDIRDRVAITRPDEIRALHRLLDHGELTTVFQPSGTSAPGRCWASRR